MIIVILFIVLLVLLQILSSKYKVVKWILPAISFLNSINIILGMIVFEGKNYIGFDNIIVFLICNIPTILFIITIYIMQEKNNLDKKFFKYIKISILIILTILIAFTLFIVKMTNERLAEFLKISETEKTFITNVASGEGLIRVKNALIPFKNKFPKDTKLYKLMTTKLEEQEKN